MIARMRCVQCQTTLSASATICPACLSKDTESFSLPSDGRLLSWTTIRRAPAGYPVVAPYDVVVVELAPGIRVTGRLVAESPPPTMGAHVKSVGHEDGCELFIVTTL